MDSAPPKIEGASDMSKTETAAEEQYETLEQAKEMDLETPQPIDVVPESRDIKGDKSESTKEDEAAKVNKKTLSAKQSATLEKARAAKAAKRKLAKESSVDGSSEPIPDPFVTIQKELANLGGRWETMHELLQDLKQRLPLQSALQENQIAPHAKKSIQLPSQSETYEDVDTTEYASVPMHSNGKRPREITLEDDHGLDDEYMAQMERYRKKNRKALNEVFYGNKQMNERASNDVTKGVEPSTASANGVMYW